MTSDARTTFSGRAPWLERALPPRFTGVPVRERDWTLVRVDRVAIEPAGQSTVPGQRRIRAVVHLGALTPADVHVLLLPVHALADDLPYQPPLSRLWSTQAYGSGTYLFETSVPAALLAGPARLKVHVRPADADDAPPFVSPVGRWRLVPEEEGRAGEGRGE